MAPVKPKLRKREIALALGAGAAATFGALLVLSETRESEHPPAVLLAEGPQAYDLAPFEEIASSGPQDVVVTVGGEQSIRAEGSPEAIAQLELVVEDGKLEIRRKDGLPANWSRLGGTTIHVTVPRLEDVAVAGSGDMTVDRIESDSFSATIAGSGDLKIGRLAVDEAVFSVVGSGTISAEGNATDSTVTILGSGEMQANNLQSQRATVTIAGSGDVGMTVTQRAQIMVGGSGDVAILGDATCSVSKAGGGDVSCAGGEIAD